MFINDQINVKGLIYSSENHYYNEFRTWWRLWPTAERNRTNSGYDLFKVYCGC